MVRLLAVACLLVVLIAGCGGSESSTTSEAGEGATSPVEAGSSESAGSEATADASTTTETAPTTETATTEAETTDAETTGTIETPTTSDVDDFPGEPFDLWVPVPEEGPVVGVVGVRYNSALNVRSAPGTTFEIVSTLEPAQIGITGAGEGWLAPSGSIWWKIDADGVVGWADQGFLSRLADVRDVTSTVVSDLGETPVAETMLDLGLIVANTFASKDVGSKVVVVVAPSVSDLGEVTYDVLGLGDDSVAGFRLHVFGQPTAGGEGFALKAVEATTLCQRGVSDGLCV